MRLVSMCALLLASITSFAQANLQLIVGERNINAVLKADPPNPITPGKVKTVENGKECEGTYSIELMKGKFTMNLMGDDCRGDSMMVTVTPTAIGSLLGGSEPVAAKVTFFNVSSAPQDGVVKRLN